MSTESMANQEVERLVTATVANHVPNVERADQADAVSDGLDGEKAQELIRTIKAQGDEELAEGEKINIPFTPAPISGVEDETSVINNLTQEGQQVLQDSQEVSEVFIPATEQAPEQVTTAQVEAAPTAAPVTPAPQSPSLASSATPVTGTQPTEATPQAPQRESAFKRAATASLSGKIYDTLEALKVIADDARKIDDRVNQDTANSIVNDRQMYINRLELAESLSVEEKKKELEGILEELKFDLNRYHSNSSGAERSTNAPQVEVAETSALESALEAEGERQQEEEKTAEDLTAEVDMAEGLFKSAKDEFLRAYKDHIQKRHIKESLGFLSQATEEWPGEYVAYKNAKKTYFKALYAQSNSKLSKEAREKMSELTKVQRASYGKQMREEMKGKTGDERKAIQEGFKNSINQFKATTLFSDIELKEREDILAARVEAITTKKKGIFGKMLSGYNKLKPWQRVVASTGVVTGALAAGGFLLPSLIGTYAGVKFIRGLVSAKVVAGVFGAGGAATLVGDAYVSRKEGKETREFREQFDRTKLDEMVENWEDRLNRMTSARNIKSAGMAGAAIGAGLLVGNVTGALTDATELVGVGGNKEVLMSRSDARLVEGTDKYLREAKGYEPGNNLEILVNHSLEEMVDVPPDKLPEAYQIMRGLLRAMLDHNGSLSTPDQVHQTLERIVTEKVQGRMMPPEVAEKYFGIVVDPNSITVPPPGSTAVDTQSVAGAPYPDGPPVDPALAKILSSQDDGVLKSGLVAAAESTKTPELESLNVEKGQGLGHTAKRFNLSDSEFKVAWKNSYVSINGEKTHISNVGLVHTDTKVTYDPTNKIFKVEGGGIGTDQDLYKAFQKEGKATPAWLKDKLHINEEVARVEVRKPAIQNFPLTINEHAHLVNFDEPREMAAKSLFSEIVNNRIDTNKAQELGFKFGDGLSRPEQLVAEYWAQNKVDLSDTDVRYLLNISRAADVVKSSVNLDDINSYYAVAGHYSIHSAYDQLKLIEFIKGDQSALEKVFSFGDHKILSTNVFESIKQTAHNGIIDVEVRVKSNGVPMHIIVDRNSGQYHLESGGIWPFKWNFDKSHIDNNNFEKGNLEKTLKHMARTAKNTP